MRIVEFPLYENGPGHAVLPNEGHEDGYYRPERFLDRIGEARAALYLADKPSGAFTVICPGGGYAGVSVDKEGLDFARLFSYWGISSLVLTYRMPGGVFVDPPLPLQDLQRALSLALENTAAWKIDPAKIGVTGFSAGGHLALGTALYTGAAGDKENASGRLQRPAFVILGYPVVRFQSAFCHMGSRDNLLGPSPANELAKRFSWETQVRPGCPPMFIVHSDDDGSVPVRNAVELSTALGKAGVPHRFLRHPSGGHGYGMGPQHGFREAPDWTPVLYEWLSAQSLCSL